MECLQIDELDAWSVIDVKNTLADFKYAKHFRAENGENGKSRYSAGKKGK